MCEQTKVLQPKKVSELLTENFFIRSYQRGYRWTENQVKDLLNDINEFKSQNCQKISSWYCLQPLVVKEINAESKTKYKLDVGKRWYEVIDGQQRLTTLYLIIHYANEMWIGRAKVREPHINYETRDGSTQFLSELKVEDDNKTIEINKENIDYFHMSSAYETIHNWVLSLGDDFDFNGFQSKLKEYTKVIWYEIAQNVNSIDVFTRLNMGKIRLTNAELVKALLLSQTALSIDGYDAQRLKQLEIAAEWDLIEKELNNIDFWSFITNERADNYYTKIELLLELSAGIAHSDSAFDLFNHYAAKSNKYTILDLWEELVANFEVLKEWYNDIEKYHLIGYLIFQSRKTNASDLIIESKSKG